MNDRTRAPRWVASAAALVMTAGALILPAPDAQAAPLQQSSGGADPGAEIVYIDGNDGFIRVLDTVIAGGAREVKWVSPEAGWREIALGDVNADGDQEILAIKGNGSNSKLVIYDPVVASASITADGKINDIPWAKLFELALPDTPRIILAGDFDAGVSGDEFLVGYDVAPGTTGEADDLFKMQVWKQNSQTPTGRSWVVHIDNRYTEERFDRGTVGQFITGGTEEFALVDEDGDDPTGSGVERFGKLEIYRVDTGWARITNYGDSKRNFTDAVFGHWEEGGSEELAAVRNPNLGQAAAFVFKFDPDDPESPKEPYSEAFAPNPRRAAFADVDADGEDELFLLRNAPGSLPRLIGRNRGENKITTWEERLGDSNDFRSIVGGDMEGDGTDELILARAGSSASDSDIIRVYRDAANVTNNFTDYKARNNRRTLLTGNLDAIGFSEGPVFSADRTLVEVTVPAGDTATVTIKLRNATTPAAVPFSISTERSSEWLAVSPTSGSTPPNNAETTITLTFSPGALAEGIYRERVIIDSSTAVANKPYSIIITMTVTPAQIFTTPAALYFSTEIEPTTPITPTEPVTPTAPASVTVPVRIYGTEGITYTASIVDAPTFAAAQAALGGTVNGAAFDGEGALVLTNPNGEWVQVAPAGSFAQSISVAAADATWPSGVPWLSAESENGVTPDTLRVTFDPSQVSGAGEERAIIVIVGDPRAGMPPANVRFVQVYVNVGVTYLPTVTK